MATSHHLELSILWLVYNSNITPMPLFIFPHCLPLYHKVRRDLLYAIMIRVWRVFLSLQVRNAKLCDSAVRLNPHYPLSHTVTCYSICRFNADLSFHWLIVICGVNLKGWKHFAIKPRQWWLFALCGRFVDVCGLLTIVKHHLHNYQTSLGRGWLWLSNATADSLQLRQLSWWIIELLALHCFRFYCSNKILVATSSSELVAISSS